MSMSGLSCRAPTSASCMRDGLADVVSDARAIGHILDLCTGSGCLAILATHAFPDAKIDASDISGDALAVAERNVADYALQDRIALIRSDLFDGLDGRHYDLILANPPYVSDAAVAAFPPEYAAEPVAAHAGGERRAGCRAPHSGARGGPPDRRGDAGGRGRNRQGHPGAGLSRISRSCGSTRPRARARFLRFIAALCLRLGHLTETGRSL